MDNFKNSYLLVAGVGIVVIGAVWYFYLQTPAQQEAAPEQTATTTQEGAVVTETQDTNATPAIDEGEVPDSEAPVEQETVSTNTEPNPQSASQPVPPQEKELGPRKPATTSPSEALEYFMEAMQAGDRERALSYVSAQMQPQLRQSLETQYKDKQLPIVNAYVAGYAGDVKLIEPGSGLYEIPVYPSQNAALPFRMNFMYDNSVQEFVIVEL